ncbi:MAG: hypothetical protein H7Y01_09595 [Ferruginibacter sp.]|nr:hypothetical protein [Chitinophagaceae bacterium]
MRTFFLLALVFLSAAVFSQRSKIETIVIGLDQKGHAETEWPFDLSFYISGAVGEDVMAVVYNYRIQNEMTRKKKWVSFPDPGLTDSTGYLKKPRGWKPGVGDNSKFVMLCDGLHPNVKYDFQFVLTRKVKLDDKLVEEMRKKLADHLKGFFKSKLETEITSENLKSENTALRGIIMSYFPGKDLRMKADTTKKFDFNIFDLSPAVRIAQAQSPNFINATTTYQKETKKVIAVFTGITSQLFADIDLIQKDRIKLNGYSKEVLKVPFNPGLDEFKAYTLLDGIKLLRQISLRPSIMEDILTGKLKIINNSFTESGGEYHTESILFLSSVLSELSSGVIRDTVEGVEVPRFSYFKSMQESFEKMSSNIRKIADARSELSQVQSLLPDILSKIVQLEGVETEVLPVVDVVSDKTPYISAEAGIAYVQTFQSVAHYRGANIYFAPIEKRAPLKNFKGINRVWKSLSFQIGVANFFGDRAVNTYSLLGKSAKTADLNLALGWRLNRIIKINAGIIPYKTNNFNSINDKTKTRAAGYVSIGIDVNLLKAFGDVATLLSL